METKQCQLVCLFMYFCSTIYYYNKTSYQWNNNYSGEVYTLVQPKMDVGILVIVITEEFIDSKTFESFHKFN